MSGAETRKECVLMSCGYPHDLRPYVERAEIPARAIQPV